MAITIEQEPHSSVMPVGQDVIFSVSDSTVLASHVNVRFFCDIYFSGSAPSSATKISTLKTTPNAAGSGIFDLRRTLEAGLSPDYMADRSNAAVSFQGSTTFEEAPIHYIAEYSRSSNTSGVFYCNFYVKGSATPSDPVSVVGSLVASDKFYIFNCVPDFSDKLFNTAGNYHYDMNDLELYQNSTTSKFLTDMPTQVYAGINDVGTVGLFHTLNHYDSTYSGIGDIHYTFKDVNGNVLGTEFRTCSAAFGGGGTYGTSTSITDRTLLFSGIYPANIKQAFTIPAGTTSYDVKCRSTSQVQKSRIYTVNIVEECEFPVTRLCWLNKYGVWDYYNFNKKSVSSTSSSKKFFNSSKGNWSGSKFKHNHYSGGKTAYSVDSKDSITLNTEYLSEEAGIWLESLINSPEVFLIKEGSSWNEGDTETSTFTDFRDMIEPVIITNSSVSRKTVINDKLIMHTFTIEKSISNNTHRS